MFEAEPRLLYSGFGYGALRTYTNSGLKKKYSDCRYCDMSVQNGRVKKDSYL